MWIRMPSTNANANAKRSDQMIESIEIERTVDYGDPSTAVAKITEYSGDAGEKKL